MGRTALQLVQQACYEANIPAPSALVGQTAPSTLQLLNLFYATGRELLECRYWPQLKKSYSMLMSSGRSSYYLPQDYYCAIPETQWDQQNNWQMQGPFSDGGWNVRLFGYVTTENRKAFRVFGPDINPTSGGGQFQVNPTPQDGDQDTLITFEYISGSWLAPPLWTAGTTYGASAYSFCSGYVYQKGSGSPAAGTVPPNMQNGFGQDGGMFWLALPSVSAWNSTTTYPAGRYVTNSGNLYYCIQGGISAGSGGPTGTDSQIDDGTVIWEYTPVLSWTGQTDYEQGDIILISSQYYRGYVAPGLTTSKTGQTQPTWSETTVSDGTITWTFKPAVYDRLVTDSDICLFDDDLMIMGLKWRFMQARGLVYADLKQEYEKSKEAAANRWQPGMKFNLAGSSYFPSGLYPNLPVGNFTL